MITCELLTCDGSDDDIVAAAKVMETPIGGFEDGKTPGLINFMLRERHGTPFEHGFLKFGVKAPIFVSREHFRHRIGNSFNEASTRYTDIRTLGTPYNVADVAQRQVGKPGAYTFEDLPLEQRHAAYDIIDDVLDYVDHAYDILRGLGLGKQDAGTILTISHPTAYIWSCNPRSLMHFLSLRNAPQARREIRMIAEQAEAAFAQRFPITHAAFVEHGRIAP